VRIEQGGGGLENSEILFSAGKKDHCIIKTGRKEAIVSRWRKKRTH
jgi:hypothetical protein